MPSLNSHGDCDHVKFIPFFDSKNHPPTVAVWAGDVHGDVN